ncbi:MAG TPA: hypothetical protein P5234_00525 [Thermoanaerobaculaceae bacterium]|nr:hypothetical protein [Thermoanaerobaculaceae bacterium]HRS14712.1 hypothetical protein [Thermoanaerobaculaceae bacterium]
MLPVVVADPRGGPSDWAFVAADQVPPAGAAGYVVEAPAGELDQAWLERVVALGASGGLVVALGPGLPPAAARPYLDAVAVEPAPPPDGVAALLDQLEGFPLVLPATDAAAAVAVLAAGAASALVPAPPLSWSRALDGLLPEYEPAAGPSGPLPTALRGPDLATVVGLPRGFGGGEVRLPGGWYARALLLGESEEELPLRLQPEAALVTLPPLPQGGVLIVTRPVDPTATLEQVEVQGERVPQAREVLARHQRQAARQARLLPRWTAEQTLLLRVEVAELSRSFSLVLAGPVFREGSTGWDWEIARTWVDGVEWRPDRLPDLPLLEPRRPPVPPLALRLEPSFRYELKGSSVRRGHRCWELRYTWVGGPERREGVACVDAATWGLVSVEETASNLPGEVRASRSVTSYETFSLGDETVWLPTRAEVDDTVAAFGGTALVRRELTLAAVRLNPDGFGVARAEAYARPNRMLRDGETGVVPLVPDGRGGRRPGHEVRPAQRFLLAGAAWDPGLATPLPFGGLQVLDFDFRGRGEQLRLLLAGVVNDGAWTWRRGRGELTLRGFVQLLPFASTVSERGRKQDGETIESTRQRLGLGLSTTLGRVRLTADAGAERWDFRRADDTARGFVLPPDTWEWTGRLEAAVPLGPATLSAAAERGWRQHWRAWGLEGNQAPEDAWTRARIALLYEKALNPLARLRVEGEHWAGWHVDRFSAPSPARFGGIRLRGIASGAVQAERLSVVRSSLAVPVSTTLRAEVGLDAGWVRDDRSGYRRRPLSGVGVSATVPGPWGTLVQGAVGMPLATPGKRSPTIELFLLRPI